MDTKIVSIKGVANSSQNSEENQDEMNTSNEDHNEAAMMADHLRQFDVLDEVQGDDSGSENDDNEPKGKRL